MSLYNRNIQNRAYVQNEMARENEESYISDISSFIKRTYQYLTASLIAATAGAYVGMLFVRGGGFLWLILELGLLFGLFAAKKNEILAGILLFAFTFVTGLTLGPILSYYVAVGSSAIIAQAFGITAVTFGALTIFAFRTNKDFSFLGKPLLITLVVIVIASLINMFIFKSPMFSVLISAACAFLFSLYILFDTQMIIRGQYDSPILAAVALYLDILNFFIAILNILGFLNSSNN